MQAKVTVITPNRITAKTLELHSMEVKKNCIHITNIRVFIVLTLQRTQNHITNEKHCKHDERKKCAECK